MAMIDHTDRHPAGPFVMMGLAILLALSSQTAQADHKSYAYAGTCFEFHGETHMIDALSHMDHAFSAVYNHRRVRELTYARSQLAQAYRELCDRYAKQQVLSAMRDLNRYLWSRDPNDLDYASEHILAALAREQVVHGFVQHPVVDGVPHPVEPRWYDPYVHQSVIHRYHHAPRYQHHHPAHITFGSKNFRITLGY